MTGARWILHVDMDAFFASVEQRDRPELRGQPVVVGGAADGRGVVCAASYEARPFGVRSAMPCAQARRLCPGAVFIPPDHHKYNRVSRQLREIFLSFTPLVEPLSLDEAFLDVTGSGALFGPAVEIAQTIQARLRTELHLTGSVGVAPNKFVAKIASDQHKPDGLTIVEPDQVQAFLDPLPVARIWGIGPVAQQQLQRLGITTIAQLRRLDQTRCQALFGTAGATYYQLCRGQDLRPVQPDAPAKSVSAEMTFDTDTGSRALLKGYLARLSRKVARQLREKGLQGRTVTLKLKTARFHIISRSQTLFEATDLEQVLYATAGQLLDQIPAPFPLTRLVGIGVSQLISPADPHQQLLFADDRTDRLRRVAHALDRITDKYGTDSVATAREMTVGHEPDG